MATSPYLFHNALQQAIDANPKLRSLWSLWEALPEEEKTSKNCEATFVNLVFETQSNSNEDLLPQLGRDLILQQVESVQGDKSTLLREESVAVAFLNALWFEGKGKAYLSHIIPPLVQRIGLVDLEIDPSKGGSKKNMEILLEAATKLLNEMVEPEFDQFPAEFKELLRITDNALSKRFEVGLALTGGIVLLRLVNPSIIFPEKRNLVPEGQITHEGRKGLVWIARIIQNLANQKFFNEKEEAFLAPMNKFLRKNRSRWNGYFQKLVTGMDLFGHVSMDQIDVKAEALLEHTFKDATPGFETGTYGLEISKLAHYSFSIEKQMRSWKCKDYPECTIYVNTSKSDPGALVYGVDLEVDCRVASLYKWMHKPENAGRTFSEAKFFKIVETLSENCRIIHSEHRLQFPFRSRDFVLLNYHDMAPSQDFALDCIGSITREDIPPVKGVIRGDFLGTQIMRSKQKDPSKLILTSVEHVNLKGLVSLLSDRTMKKMALNHCYERTKARITFYSDPKILAEIHQCDEPNLAAS